VLAAPTALAAVGDAPTTSASPISAPTASGFVYAASAITAPPTPLCTVDDPVAPAIVSASKPGVPGAPGAPGVLGCPGIPGICDSTMPSTDGDAGAPGVGSPNPPGALGIMPSAVGIDVLVLVEMPPGPMLADASALGALGMPPPNPDDESPPPPPDEYPPPLDGVELDADPDDVVVPPTLDDAALDEPPLDDAELDDG
jgi:hypothetical protein